MSPLSIRRYRAERLLRADFERLRGTVTALVERRLRAADVRLDRSDVDAAYSHAWHGLYAAVVEGREIENPAGWLATVTFRRALDEHRSRSRSRNAALALVRPARHGLTGDRPVREAAADPDLASALDDRIRLRQLMEGLRSRLSGRELEAASLCYLQGLPRSQAAARMGVSDAAMRRLMDGRRGRPGVAQKFGSLVGTIDSGEWCAEQGSLMRGLAYGILDPAGERYRLALSHHRECSACRSYVLSLRGLAAVLPPVPLVLHLALLASSGPGAGAGAGAGTGAGAASAGAGAGSAGAGAGAGAASASGGAVGAASATGAAGGGWLIASAGPAATKLAVGCLLALGVGAGCVALGGAGERAHDAARAPAHAHSARADVRAAAVPALGSGTLGGAGARPAQPAARRSATAAVTATARAPREFGLEAVGAPVERGSNRTPEASAARALTAAASEPHAASAPVKTAPRTSSEGAEPSAGAAAAREFAPG